MKRQFTQSFLQFATVLVAELTALAMHTGGPPTSLAELWVPVLTALGASLAIWSGSKIQVGGS